MSMQGYLLAVFGGGDGLDFHQKIGVGEASDNEIGCRGRISFKPLVAQGPVKRYGFRSGLGYEDGELDKVSFGHACGLQDSGYIGQNLFHLGFEALPD